tara:strand:- start:48 stop:572 length:525 start_codon:yes stop_codon:yes gene_type:complete
MAQEFTINSSAIESKINQLLPSQGGFGAGVDFSASTMVIPIVDLTETAEGSDVRPDLQTALSHSTITSYAVSNTTTTIITTTGYFRLFGVMSSIFPAASTINISITDGATTKILLNGNANFKFTNVGSFPNINYDFIVFLKAGDSVIATSGSADTIVTGTSRQIADINGNLIDP